MGTGYPEYYVTGRRYMTKEGDYREDKDVEWQLDGIGGVNIVVKADVHKSGKLSFLLYQIYSIRSSLSDLPRVTHILTNSPQASTSPATPSRTKPRQRASRRWPSARNTKSLASPTTSSGTSTRLRSLVNAVYYYFINPGRTTGTVVFCCTE